MGTTYGVGIPTYGIWGHLPTEFGDYLRSFGTTYLQNLDTPTYLLKKSGTFGEKNDIIAKNGDRKRSSVKTRDTTY